MGKSNIGMIKYNGTRNFTKSFYDWCIETNNEYMLNLWDYELNTESPKEVSYTSCSTYYFKCERGIHPSELFVINNITGHKHQKVKCRRCQSFGQWCVDNNQLDLLRRWDCELNKISPFEVFYSSSKKFYFKCPVNNPNHPSELKMLSNLIKQPNSRRCIACVSFGQWAVDNIPNFFEDYWSDKNTLNPFTVEVYSEKSIWIKCTKTDYHEDYQISIHNFAFGERCPYCARKKVNYYDSVGYQYPSIVKLWSDKNEKSPYEYSVSSGKYVILNCPIHGEYKQKIRDFVKGGAICKYCKQELGFSSLEIKVRDYITKKLKYNCLHERDCTILPINPLTNYGLPFDNEIPELKLIIEVNGKQHYEICGFTILSAKENNKTPEEILEYQKWKDQYKMEYAISQGYYYLVIPYWAYDKQKTYQKMIDEKINEILLKENELKYQTVTTAGDTEQLAS